MKQYYYVTEAGEQVGPVTMEGLRVAGIGRDTLVWCEGMADWAEAEQLPELAEFFVEAMPCPPPPPRRRPRAAGSDSDTQTASSAGDDVPPSIPNRSGTVNGANAVPPAASVYSGGSHGAAPAQTKRNPVWLVFAGVFFLVFIGITLFSVLSLHNQRIEDENALVVVDSDEMTTYEKLEAEGYEYAGLIPAYSISLKIYSWHPDPHYYDRHDPYHLFVKNDGMTPVYALLWSGFDKYVTGNLDTPVRCDVGYYDEDGYNYKRFNYRIGNFYFCIE